MDARDAMARIDSHELVCAERYSGIQTRLSRLEKIILGSTGTLLIGMAGIILKGVHLI